MDIFLTFLIVTYRRPKKVARLLNLFLDERWRKLDYLKFEVVIADDHGEDNTLETIGPVIQILRKRGWSVRYVYRESNLRGDRNLYYGYTRDSSGKFVWFLCDDDVLNVGQTIPYLELVRKTNPLISICGFVQGRKGEHRNSLGGDVRLVQDFAEAVDYLIQFPKTTAYLLRRCADINLDSVFERWDRTMYSWIGLSIYLFAAKKNEGLLLYPPVVANADNDYGLLPYSFRVFCKLYFVARDSVELSGMSFERIGNGTLPDEICLCLSGLHTHYSWRTPVKYTPAVLKEEYRFLRTHWLGVFRSRRRLVPFIKFVIFFLASNLVPDSMLNPQKISSFSASLP